jgi:OOP family OmpA-OmpF porin
MFKKIIVLSLIIAVLAPLPAMAGMYGGAAIGNSWFNVKPEAADIGEISESSTGWKIFGGFKNDGFLGVEGGYRDMGEVTYQDSGFSADSKTNGWDIEAVGRVKVAIVDIFAKAGAFFWETKLGGDASGSTDGTAFIWGIGAGVRLGPIGVRLEWESMEVKEPDTLSMLSLGATLGF